PGFCVTAEAYATFISERELDQSITQKMKTLDYENNDQLNEVSAEIREWILQTDMLESIEVEIRNAYEAFSQDLNVT
ncbi:PEP/pyruvate-binding domain-containing protein, partial [Planococcus sp. SIMBA_143]